MSRKGDVERNETPPDDESIPLPNTTSQPQRSSSRLLENINEHATLPSPGVMQRAFTTGEGEAWPSNTSRNYSGGPFDEAAYRDEHDTSRSQQRHSLSTYTMHTRSSQAKQSEKVELPSRKHHGSPRPGSGARWSPSAQLYFPQTSPVMTRTSTLGKSRRESPVGNYESQPSKKGNHRAQSRSGEPGHESRVNGDVGIMLNQWKQQKKEAEEGFIRGSESELLDQIEKFKAELERVSKERNEALRCTQALRQQLEEGKGETVSLGKDEDLQDKTPDLVSKSQSTAADTEDWKNKYDELFVKNQELEAAASEHDVVKSELQSSKAGTEELRQNYDTLVNQNQELVAKYLQSQLDSDLRSREAEEAENKELREAITEKDGEILKLQNELKEISDSAKQTEDEAFHSSNTIKQVQKAMRDINEAVEQFVQTMSDNKIFDARGFEDLIESFSDNTEASNLLINIGDLMGKFMDKNQSLEAQVGDLIFEVNALKNMAAGDYLPSKDEGLLEIMHERQKREGAVALEELQRKEAMDLKKQKVLLQQKNRGLQLKFLKAQSELQKTQSDLQKTSSELQNAQEELPVLRKKITTQSLTLDCWKDEVETTRRELEKRKDAIQDFIRKQQVEVSGYIKEYHDKKQDESYWSIKPLQKKLEVLEAEYKRLKLMFDRSRREDIKKTNELVRLETVNQLTMAHIENIEQAFLQGKRLPRLPEFPTLKEEEEPFDDSSDSDCLFPSTCPPSPVRFQPYIAKRIPRCQLPDSISDRKVALDAYRNELKAKTDQEILEALVAKPYSGRYRAPSPAESIMRRVRSWRMSTYYPPDRKSWSIVRTKSAFELWDGWVWMEHWATKSDLETLAQGGILPFETEFF